MSSIDLTKPFLSNDVSDWKDCWPISGYAPGGYLCLCKKCDVQFYGDKRARECGSCALKSTHKLLKDFSYSTVKVDETIRALQEKVKNPSERIIAAAIYHGATISLPPPARHHTILESMHLTMGIDVKKVGPENQGFLTSKGRFVNRVEAYHIAWRESQMIRQTGSAPELFSEDLW